jgi:hypothetical protein
MDLGMVDFGTCTVLTVDGRVLEPCHTNRKRFPRPSTSSMRTCVRRVPRAATLTDHTALLVLLAFQSRTLPRISRPWPINGSRHRRVILTRDSNLHVLVLAWCGSMARVHSYIS